MSEFTFPDSGIKIEIDRVSYIVSRMVEEELQESYPDKPIAPFREVKDVDNKVLQTVELSLDPKYYNELLTKPNVREEDKKVHQQDLDTVNAYLKAKREWDTKVADAYGQRIRLLYAKRLKSKVDPKAVAEAIAQAKELGIDLEKKILANYAKSKVQFDKESLPNWIFLWCVCAVSVADISAFNSWMTTGSKEALQATRNALSLF